MKESLTKKVGPLPVWGWALIAGGGLGALILAKRAKAKAATTPEGTEPIPQTLEGALAGTGSAGGAGGGGELGAGGVPGGEAKSNPEASPAPHVEGTPVEQFLATEHELEAGGWQPPHTSPTGSAAPATSAALSHSKGGSPRAGVPFKAGKYKGLAAHIYAKAVPGGVGPGKNVIVLGGPAKKTHQKAGSHIPKHHHQKVKHKPSKPKKTSVHHHPKRRTAVPHR